MATAKRRRRNPDDEPAGIKCEHCDEISDDTEKVGEEQWCRRCRRSDASTCEHCSELYDNTTEEAQLVSGETWCPACVETDDAFHCQRCEKYFEKNVENAEYPDDRDGPFCESCSEDLEIFTCESCDHSYTSSQYGGDSLCQECYDERENEHDGEDEDTGPVEGYHSHDRLWNRFGDSSSRIYYGVELEAIHEDRHGDYMSVAGYILDKYGMQENKEFLFTEQDCTLNDRGYETIFHPMSPEFIISNRKLLASILEDMTKKGMVSYEAPDHGVSAGMHVSVMYSRLSRFEKIKLLRLIYDNPQLTAIVSRRPPEHLQRFARVTAPAPLSQMVMKKRGYDAKMVAVNLKRVRDARVDKYIELAEVRIFRGTLKPESFLMNIEYVIACVTIAKNYRYGLTDTTEQHIKDFIAKHQRSFPHIHAWMKSKGLIP